MDKVEVKKPDRVKLQEWLDSIPSGELKEVKERLMNECCISRFTLARWICGRSRIPELSKRVIEEKFNAKIF